MKLFKTGGKGNRSAQARLAVKHVPTTIKLILSCAFLILSVEAVAENKAAPATGGTEGDYVTEKRGDTTFKYKKKTTYDFEGSSIEGMYNKPSGSYISNIKDVKGRSIIRIRENFDDEVIDSVRLLK